MIAIDSGDGYPLQPGTLTCHDGDIAFRYAKCTRHEFGQLGVGGAFNRR
jgi:hypothetical protein